MAAAITKEAFADIYDHYIISYTNVVKYKLLAPQLLHKTNFKVCFKEMCLTAETKITVDLNLW